jgi:acetyl-CoA C-acetyltransferase
VSVQTEGNEIVILSAVRTPIGAFLGNLKSIPGPRLGASCVKEAVQRAGITAEMVDECLMGEVLTAGVGQAPARQAALLAGLPPSVRCTTLNRVCGSGLRTVMWADQILRCNDANVIVAGGMESMSQAPYLLENGREGYRLGNGALVDSMIKDGLWDVYNNYHMGNAAELCAKEKNINREDQDRFATLSYRRALAAVTDGKFKSEIVPIEVPGKETKVIDTDEEPFKAKLDRFAGLKPVFTKDGTITAANASSLSDGASAMVLTTRAWAERHGLKPLARIVAQASHAQAPEWFTTAPIGAIEKVLERAGVKIEEVDYFEINEAFSVVALACIRALSLKEDRVNVRGGAVALGHPIGASGARILTTLIHTLKDENKKLGLATLCIGGGEASALLVEVLH